MADKYPTLTQMGINHPEQIRSYSLTNTDKNSDLLRIRYKRPSGSILPVTRSYEFERVSRPSDAGPDLISHEISPLLNEALTELEKIVRFKKDKEALIDELIEQIQSLERELIGELTDLRRKISSLAEGV